MGWKSYFNADGHILGRDVIQFLEIMNNIQNVTNHEMKSSEVRGNAVGGSVWLRRNQQRQVDRDEMES